MTRPRPIIDDYMSPSPYRIEHDRSLDHAREMMSKYDIRHLPVMAGERIVGVLSERDLALFECMQAFDTSQITVGMVMTDDPYAVEVGADLCEVAISMRARKIGSAIVTEGGQLVGLFTTMDALRALADVLS